MAVSKGATKGVQNPLQLFGLFMVGMEGGLAASLFATASVEHWTRYALIVSAAVAPIAYVGIAGYLLIYLARERPGFLFNPSDFDKSVQHMLFGPDTPKLEITNPPEIPNPPGAAHQ